MVFTILLLTIGTATLALTPFPLSYASSLLPMTHHTDVKDMGAGSYEAAQYLNSLPDAEHMLIWTDKDGVCKFFVGRCKRGLNYQSLRDEEDDEAGDEEDDEAGDEEDDEAGDEEDDEEDDEGGDEEDDEAGDEEDDEAGDEEDAEAGDEDSDESDEEEG